MNIRKKNTDGPIVNTHRISKDRGPKKTETKKPENEIFKEIGGPKGLEPTRYGDWEQKGRCTDF